MGGPSIEPGHSIHAAPDLGHAPRPVWYNVTWYRHRAEELGDLAIDMIHEGLDGMAYGSARKAAHYGRVANDLYKERAEELVSDHPEWGVERETPPFLKGLAVALVPSILLWWMMLDAVRMVLR